MPEAGAELAHETVAPAEATDVYEDGGAVAAVATLPASGAAAERARNLQGSATTAGDGVSRRNADAAVAAEVERAPGRALSARDASEHAAPERVHAVVAKAQRPWAIAMVQ